MKKKTLRKMLKTQVRETENAPHPSAFAIGAAAAVALEFSRD